MILTRRRLLTSLLAAPLVVRPGILMPVRPLPADLDVQAAVNRFLDMANERMRKQMDRAMLDMLLYGRSYVSVSYHGIARVDAIPS